MDRAKRILTIVGIVLLLFAHAGGASIASASGQPGEDEFRDDGSGQTQQREYLPGVLGQYYDSADITNESALKVTRLDTNISRGFGYDSPIEASKPEYFISPENYSIRWSGYIRPEESGSYVFKTLSDDGVRMTIDLGNGQETIINSWGLLSLDYSSSKGVKLEKGKFYPFVLEYQQGPLYAAVHLFWELNDVPLGVIPSTAFYVDKKTHSEYVNEPKYSNLLDRDGEGLINFFEGEDGGAYKGQGNVDYDWGSGAPEGIKSDQFWGKMYGYIVPRYTEPLVLTFRVDDALRVWIDGKRVIEAWDWHNQEVFECKVDAKANKRIRIEIEYADFGLGASIRMGWKSRALGIESGIIPIEFLHDRE
jgi:hypothetical protein